MRSIGTNGTFDAAVAAADPAIAGLARTTMRGSAQHGAMPMLTATDVERPALRALRVAAREQQLHVTASS
jgi:hypothetical protein